MSDEKIHLCQEWPPTLGSMERAYALVNPNHYVLTILVQRDDAETVKSLWAAEMIPQSSRTNIGVLWDAFVIPSRLGVAPRVILEEYDLDHGDHHRVNERVVLELDPSSPLMDQYRAPPDALC